jgi:hypothetical protein
VATYYSRTGELDVEAVDHEVLVDAAQRCLSGSRALLGGPSDPTRCGACASLLRRPPMVVVESGVPDPVAAVVTLSHELAA